MNDFDDQQKQWLQGFVSGIEALWPLGVMPNEPRTPIEPRNDAFMYTGKLMLLSNSPIITSLSR